MIKRLNLKNWKSFESAQLWVDPITFIIGTNSAGKSNIVDALSFLSFIAGNNRISSCIVRGGYDGIIRRNENECSLAIELTIGNDDYEYEIRLRNEGKEPQLWAEKLTVRSNGRDKVLFSTQEPLKNSNKIVALVPKDKPGSYKEISLKREMTVLSQIPNINVVKEVKEGAEAVADSLQSIFILEPKPDKMRAYTPIAETLASDGSNIAGVIAGLPGEEKNRFEQILINYVRPLLEKDLTKIWAEPIGRFKTDAMLYCEEEWVDGNTTEFDARSMSDGTLRFIAIVSALLSAKEGSTIVIEEVDNGLHPSRAGELVMALKEIGMKRKLDIICSTHNPVLIDALGPEMLPFISYVSRSELSGNSEIKLLEDAPHLLKLLARYTPGDMMINGLLSSETK